MNIRLARKQTGFTIVEVVIALTILSLIMLAMVTAMRTLGDTQTRVKHVIDRSAEMRMVSRFLRHSIGQAVPVLRQEEGEKAGTYFQGKENELIWAAPISAGAIIGGLNVAKLSLENSQLVLQFQSFVSSKEEPDWSKMKKEVLLEQVDGLTIGYRLDMGEEWENEWERGPVNPRTVRLMIKKEGRFWPELIIALGAGRPGRR